MKAKFWASKEVRIFMILVAIQSLATGWFFSTYVLFLQAHGLSFFLINLLNFGFMTVSFFLDPITGWLADKVGQRRVYVWGQGVYAAGMFIYWLGRSFPFFLLAECTGAVGHALVSQALESWLRNSINEQICNEAIKRSEALRAQARIPSALLGGLIGTFFGFQWPWLAAAICSGISVVVSLVLFRGLPLEQKRGIAPPSVLKVARLSLQSPPLRFSLIIAFVIGACVTTINMFWSPVLKEASGATWWLGFVWIGFSSASTIGSLSIKKEWKHNGLLPTLLLLGIPLFVPVFFPNTLIIMAPILVHEIGRGAVNQVLFWIANPHIKDEYRSTANSVRSSVSTLGQAAGLLISGTLTLPTKVFLPAFVLQLGKSVFNRLLPAWVLVQFSPLQIWFLSAIALTGLAIYAWRRK